MSRFEANPFMYWHGKLLAVKMDAMIIKSSKTSQREIVIAKDPSELYAEENVKIMFRMSEEETARAEAWLAEHPDPDYAAFKTQSTLIEFMDPRLSKGFAIREMQKLGEYEPHEILAFGDTTNDNSMLEEAGWGVCLANGSDDTKACADDVTRFSCRDDGFADYLESWLFREESGKN
jgi:hydroxymethylpyrimidine pyrophosphatase-like HAD family hydrolase